MDETTLYQWLVVGWMLLAASTFVVLLFVTAPYGRFSRSGWGPRIKARWGWVLMETPVLVTFLALYALGDRRTNPVCLVLVAFWVAHYANRSFIYPFRLRSYQPSVAVSVIAMGVAFNVGNGYLNGRYLFSLGPELQTSWLLDPRFVLGALLFWSGYVLNQYSDRLLILLRASGETGYRIPHGGAYKLVSCPNYLGEMVEWAGWALACWNLGALAFLVWTVANLAPRAIRTHHWYQEEFSDYPTERRAFLPFIL